MEEAETAEVSAQIEVFLAAWFRMRQTVMEANFHRAHQQGLSATQFMLLNLLEQRETEAPWTLRALATALNLQPTTLVQTVDSLEQRGLVARQRARTDRRQTHISLTEAGHEVQRDSQRQFHERLAAIFHVMQPAQRRALIDGLEAFAAAALAPQVAPQEEQSNDDAYNLSPNRGE